MEEIITYALQRQNVIDSGVLFIYKDSDGRISHSTEVKIESGLSLAATFKIFKSGKPYTQRDFEWQYKQSYVD